MNTAIKEREAHAVPALWALVIVAALAVWGLLACAPHTAMAATIDLSSKGSLQVVFRDPTSKEPVQGGELALYRVASVKYDDGNAVYEYTGDFADCTVELGDLSSASLASDLAAVLPSSATPVATSAAGNDGKVSFSGLELGLYLLVQPKAAGGYQKVSPFVVSVPQYQEDTDTYIYDVDATPKMETLTATTPETPETPEKPNVPEDGKPVFGMPKTGDDTMIFAGVLVAAGVAALLLGTLLSRKKAARRA